MIRLLEGFTTSGAGDTISLLLSTIVSWLWSSFSWNVADSIFLSKNSRGHCDRAGDDALDCLRDCALDWTGVTIGDCVENIVSPKSWESSLSGAVDVDIWGKTIAPSEKFLSLSFFKFLFVTNNVWWSLEETFTAVIADTALLKSVSTGSLESFIEVDGGGEPSRASLNIISFRIGTNIRSAVHPLTDDNLYELWSCLYVTILVNWLLTVVSFWQLWMGRIQEYETGETGAMRLWYPKQEHLNSGSKPK